MTPAVSPQSITMFPYGNIADRVIAMQQLFIDTIERLAHVVRAARVEQGGTQADLATRAGVGRRFVVDVEAGHPRAELGKTLALLRTLGIQPLAVPVAPEHMRVGGPHGG